MAKLTFDEAMEKISDGQNVFASSVLASALNRKIWVAEWHIPGCISESFNVCLTKAEAVDSALGFADTEDGPPRGMKAALIKRGDFQHKTPLFGIVVTTIERTTLHYFCS